MFHMPHQVTYAQKNNSVFLVFLLYILGTVILPGCSSTEVREFEPPVYPPPPEQPRFIYERTIRSSADVKEKTFGDRFKQAVTGVSDSAEGLNKPYGVAAYHGKIYATDTVQRAILEFDIPNKKFKRIGTEGTGTIVKPIGITVDRNSGDVYVVDATALRVMVYDQDGKFLRAIGTPEYLRRPSGAAVSPDGTKLYIVDTGGVDDNEHHRFTIWDSRTGEFIKAVGTRGVQPGQFNLPLQIATSPNGTVYVVDGGNFRIQAFTPDGEYIRSFGSIGTRTGQFARPKGISIDKDGNIYVVDTSFGNFQIFNSDGQLLLFVGNRGAAGGPGQYMLPAGIFVDEDGRVYMVDQYFKKIDIFRPANLKPNEGWLSTKN